MLFAILCNESPFTSITVTDQHNNTTCIVEQEVLSTLQDWLWYKLIIILLYQQVFHYLPTLSKTGNAEEYSFEYLQQYIQTCDSNVFDMNGTKPFSYIQILLLINQYEEAIQYLLNHNYVIPAVMLSFLFYYYGILADNDNRDNYYYVCLGRILPQLRNRIDLATYLIAVIRDISVKMNFCIVSVSLCVDDQKLLVLSSQSEILVGRKLDQNQRSKGLFDELADLNVNEVIKETACILNVREKGRDHV